MVRKEAFKDEVKEVIVYKSTLIIEDKDVKKYRSDKDRKLWKSGNGIITIRPEEYESIIYAILEYEGGDIL